MIGDSVASLVGVALISSLQHLCAHGTAGADVYAFVILLKLLIVLSCGPVRLPPVCFIIVAWLRISVGDPFTCWVPLIHGWSDYCYGSASAFG